MRLVTILLVLLPTITAQGQDPDPPKITLAPKNQKVTENGIVTFICKASGNPEPMFYWERNSNKINNKKKRYMVQSMPHGSVLRIEPVIARKDNAVFTCIADNGIDEPARANASLHVYPQEQLKDIPSGYPRIDISPALKSVEKDRDYIPVDLSDPRLTLIDGSLQITRSQESDAGKYECVAENAVGVAYSFAAMLYVRVRRVPPHFTVKPEAVEVSPGHDVNLTCVAVGSPMPFVRWREANVDLDENTPIGRNILELKNVRESKNYTCVASSDLGNIEYTTHVRVEAPLPPVNLASFEVRPTSVRLRWESANGDTDISYNVQYKPKNDSSTFTEVEGIKEKHFTVRQLRVFTPYIFRVKALNQLGFSKPSQEIVARTGEIAPGTAPDSVRARPVSPVTVVVQWEEPKITNGIIQGYKVFYTLNPDLPITLWKSTEVNGDNKLATITHLQTNRTYTMSVLAFSNGGQGPLSEPIQVMTRQNVPLQPRNLYGTAVSPNEIAVNWDAPEDIDKVKSYNLYFNDSHLRQNGHRSIDPPVPMYRLTDLTPDTLYHIQVSALSEHGEGVKTPTLQVRTKPFIPAESPQAVSGRPVNSRSIEVTWEPPPPDKQNGVITGYRILYAPNEPGLSADDANVITVSFDKRSYILRELSVWTDYRIWLLAFTDVGDGPPSEPIAVKTDEDVPGEPKRVKVESVNSTAVFVEWRPPQTNDRNGIIRGYYVYYIEVDDNDNPVGTERVIDTGDGNRNQAVITGLEPDTRYHIRVAGYTRKGDGVRSRYRIVSTTGAVPSPPRNLYVRLLSEDQPQVQVTWQKPHEVHGDLKGYKVVSGRQGEIYQETTLNPEQHLLVSDYLDKGALYEFRVSARNQVGWGERAVETIRTPDGVPAGAPLNFSAVGLSETSVRLEWDLPAKNLRNGEVIMYQLTYHKLSDAINVEDMNVTEAMKDIAGLEMNTDYIFQIKAYTSRGAGPWSPKLQFHTFGRMPPSPKNVKIQRTSERTIQVTWDEPAVPTAGYRIYYSMFVLTDMSLWQNVEIGPYTVAEITGLEPHNSYAVCVQAKSVDGRYGNLSTIVTTDFNPKPPRPEDVRDLRVSYRKSREIRLLWSPPQKSNVNSYVLVYQGIKRYRERGVMKTDISPPKDLVILGRHTGFTVQNLIPKMKYTFNISVLFEDSSTSDNDNSHITAETRIEAPPRVKEPVPYTIQRGQVGLSLTPASEKNGPLSHYYLVVVPVYNATKNPEDFTEEELTRDRLPVELPATQPYIAAKLDAPSFPSKFQLGDNQDYNGFMNRYLNPDIMYKVFLRAYTDLMKSSMYSDTIKVSPYMPPGRNPQHDPDRPRPSPDSVLKKDVNSSKSMMMIMIVAPVCAGIVLIIIVCIIVVLYLRRKSHRKEKSPEPTKMIVDFPPHPSDPVEMRRQHYQTPAMISHPPIPIHMLAEHIDSLKSTDNLKFSQEYESIEPGQQFTWDNSNLEINKPKNRYANVIAYDHSRVILQPLDGIPGSDYVNANYMDGYRKQNAYIATQGPLPETFGDFWRMVWEQRSATLVMMTKLEERQRIKCDQYWPGRGVENYGLMQVLLVDVTELSTYTIRTFHISRYGCPEKREVRQFQFTAWPDHGVPDHPTPLLMFMRRVKASNPPDAGPMIVHCSAGVGRTGAFIVIDAMLERIKHERTVDIYGHVTCLRAQRNYMVQTEDQYIFIHDALLEAVTCGNTEVPARNLSAHIQKLMQPDQGETVTGMELEYKRLASMKASPNRFVSANLPVNKFKNRLVNILPYESTRVALQPIRGVDGSDYINASFIDGYRYRKAYVATQGPLAETTEDFWRMLWEHNSTIIVMLTKLREMGREKCHQYWPSERSARYQYFVVDPMAEYNMPQYILREFKVTDARDGQSRTIRQFQFTEWPEQGVPKSGEGFIDFIGQVHKTKEQFGQEGPISVHCSAGVGRTGVFITLSIVLERMRYEGVVDMFQTVKMLRTQRPAMVQTEDQYQFCYRAALEYLGSFDHYAT
ncbi:hypothetical protein ScPMuIL_006692 [Solemya velum]